MQDMRTRRLTRRDLIGIALSSTAFGCTGWHTDRAGAEATPEPTEFPPFPEFPPLPPATPRPEGPLRVVTSTAILADLTRQVGGERVDVSSILPANADPHDFEVQPGDLVKISEADLVIMHGLKLDAWIEPLIENAGGNAPVVVATTGIATIASDEDAFSEGDPHVWFDPQRTKQMVANIAQGLISIDPPGEPDYQARMKAYQANLDLLDAEIAKRIALIPPERRKLVTNHDSLAYFAERYGLTVVGTVIPGIDTRTEPSAKDISELVDRIKREGVPAIFTENTVSPRLAEALAEQAGVRVVASLYTDSLGEPGSGADTYIGMMEMDTRIIVEALR